jgi:hypothetical protein
MRPWSSPRRSPDAASRLRLGALGAAGPLAVGWEMRSSLIAIWVTDYKLPRGVNDKLRDN